MRVLQFYRTYMPETQGGLEESIRQICLATAKYGVEQRVLTLARVSKQETVSLPEAKVIRIPLQLEPASCSIGLQMFRAYRKQVEWADIIHIHYPWPFADLVHLLSGSDKPVVLTYHSDIIRQDYLNKLYAPLRSLFFRRVGRFVATSPNYLETSPLLKKMKKTPAVIPLGLSAESYETASENALLKVKEIFGENFFLFVGVLRYYKGLHTLINAAKINGLPVVIAGHGPDTNRLQKLARKLDADNIHFAGYVNNDIKQALYHYCRAVVFPSCERSEAFGVTLLEGQLNSKPLISCEIGTGTSYVNVDNQTGLIVPPEDPQALASAMMRLHEDRKLAVTLGAGGRQRLDKLFSGEQIGRRYTELYRELIEDKKSSAILS